MLTLGGENTVVGREMDAITSIDMAIADIKRASIDDGKDLQDHPPIDAKLKHRGRLRKVDALLAAARKDLNYKEGDPAALGWRKEAIEHVNEADRPTRKRCAICTMTNSRPRLLP